MAKRVPGTKSSSVPRRTSGRPLRLVKVPSSTWYVPRKRISFPLLMNAWSRQGDGPDWVCFSGELRVKSQIKIGGFKAGGLSLKDYLVLSMTPPDPTRTVFNELRQVVPVRLTTDSWSSDGAGQTFSASDYSVPHIAPEHRISVAPPAPGYRRP